MPDLRFKQTGEEWEKEKGHEILDHDGWRYEDGVSFFNTPITEADYLRRYGQCTVRNKPERKSS